MGKYLDIRSDMWREEFEKALPYEEYLAASGEPYATNWRGIEERISTTDEQAKIVGGFARKLNVLVYSGVWCGDCVRQGPMYTALAKLNDMIDLRFAERQDDSNLAAELRINGALKVPVAVFLSEDFYELGRFGDRLLTAYRRMARDRLGQSCQTGLIPPPDDQLSAELAEWCDIFERMHIILRLSPMLMGRYGD